MSPVGVYPRQRRPLYERLDAKIDRSGGPDACWPWTAGLRNGYGVIGLGAREDGIEYAHRLVWVRAFGPIPAGLFVCHNCDNPPCCNPAHYFLGTHGDNMRDAASKGRGHGNGLAGEHHPLAKLTKASAAWAREQHALGRSGIDIARQLHVSSGTISGAINGKTWVSA